MRKPRYLSPSAIAKWVNEGVEAYYLHYLSDNPPPRMPQNQPMSVGSAFDAYVKAHLFRELLGDGHKDAPRFQFDAIFTAQVEEQNRDWARAAGKHCFEEYESSGALLDLLADMRDAQSEPRFEFELCGPVYSLRAKSTKEDGVVLLGKPDAYYVNKEGIHVILDWKVNGYCARYPRSPSQGYVRLRTNGVNQGHHKKCSPALVGGILINQNGHLEAYEKDWARQLSIYSWLLGEAVGGDFIVAVDQLACSPNGGGRDPFGNPLPAIRVAEHRSRISADFQHACYAEAALIWEAVTTGHIFRDMTLEESMSRCALLDEQTAISDDMFDSFTSRR